jgi:hypothetical protein
MTKDLPTLPRCGHFHENSRSNNDVQNTPPEAYLEGIKALGRVINDYRDCLAFKGYILHGSVESSDLYAKKEIFVL